MRLVGRDGQRVAFDSDDPGSARPGVEVSDGVDCTGVQLLELLYFALGSACAAACSSSQSQTKAELQPQGSRYDGEQHSLSPHQDIGSSSAGDPHTEQWCPFMSALLILFLRVLLSHLGGDPRHDELAAGVRQVRTGAPGG